MNAEVIRLAREMLESLDRPADLRRVIELLTPAQIQQLYRTVDPNYDKYDALVRENLSSYSDTLDNLQGIAQIAWFYLGLAAASLLSDLGDR